MDLPSLAIGYRIKAPRPVSVSTQVFLDLLRHVFSDIKSIFIDVYYLIYQVRR